MGFVTQTSTLASPPLANGVNIGLSGNLAAPTGLEAGDLLIVIQATDSVPATALSAVTGGSGNAWTNLIDKQAGSSSGGRVRVDKRVAVSTDVGATFHVSSTGGSSISAYMICVRSDQVAGGSLTVTATDVEFTVAAVSYSIPQLAVGHTTDLRVLLTCGTVSGSLIVPPSESGLTNCPMSVPIWQQWGSPAGNLNRNLQVTTANRPSGSDTGATTWTTASSQKLYAVKLAISDGTSTDPNIGSGDLEEFTQVVIPALSEAHDNSLTVDSVTGRGGGGGISVF